MHQFRSLKAFCSLIIAASIWPLAAVNASELDLPAQPLSSALRALGDQTKINVLFEADSVEGRLAPAVKGARNIGEALTRLLVGTGLTYRFIKADTVTLIRASAVTATPGLRREGAEVTTKADEGKVMRVSQVDAQSAKQSEDAARRGSSSTQKDNAGIEEIVVTAQKRAQRLQDVPVPVTSISAAKLVDANQLQLQDYYTRIPALSLTTSDPYGGAMVAIRGLTTGGYNNPTVGVIVDDVPYTSTTSGGAYVAGDIEPSELSRIEVLRGPQGTLYGASSIGGLLKYVTVDPSTETVSGRLQGGVSSVRNGDEPGYNMRGAINMPLGDTVAARVSGFARRDPGYIDDPVHDIDGLNWAEVAGGRLSVLWRLSRDISLKLGALVQRDEAHGSSYVAVPPGVDSLELVTVPEGTGYEKRIQVYSANLTARLGGVELTAVSAYADKDNVFLYDGTSPLATFLPGMRQVFGPAATGVTNYSNHATEKFTQEVRITSTIGEKVDWLLGAFYNHEKSNILQDFFANDFSTGEQLGIWSRTTIPTTLMEYAAFANLTFHLTDRLEVQIGGRGSRIEQTRGQTNGPIFNGVPGTVVAQATTRSKETPFTYLFTPQYNVSADLMLYARLASGYRPGGPNTALGITQGLPPEYGPDKAQNYEIGVKGNAIDHALSFDLSAYRIDWRDIQLNLVDPVTRGGYFGNGGQARSQGLEISAEFKPLPRLTVAGWIAWNDAELTEDFPASSTIYGFAGDRLPTSSRFSGNISVDREFPLRGDLEGFVGGSVSYVGERLGLLKSKASTPDRQVFPAYTKTDLRAGVRYESWTVNLFVNNVTDKRALLTGGLGAFYTNWFTIIQPRTMGLSIARDF